MVLAVPYISRLTKADMCLQGYIKSYFIIPGLIYGTALGSLADARIHETLSPRISRLLLAALDRGRPGMIGNGEAIWPNVHVVDGACAVNPEY